MKKCINCGKPKQLDDFPRRKLKKDGRLNECKVCHRKYRRETYNSEDKAKYYIKNKETVLYKNKKHKIISKCKNVYSKPMNRYQMINALKSLVKNLDLFTGKDYELVRDTQMKLYCEFIDNYDGWYKIEEHK